MSKFNVSIAEAVEALNKVADKKFITLLRHGTMSVEYFAPKNIDTQQPHSQDEIYIVASGTSQFYRDGEIINCSTGDVIFVPAKMEHRFINFTENFATWVIFYGSDGGELTQ